MSKSTISNFVCSECGFIIPLPRTESVRRKKGHIKDLFCPCCKAERKFKEYHSDQYIKTENGRFVGRIK